MEANKPEVVAEVSALFERYEQALIDENVEVLEKDIVHPDIVGGISIREQFRIGSEARTKDAQRREDRVGFECREGRDIDDRP